jgi:hypothetical protein
MLSMKSVSGTPAETNTPSGGGPLKAVAKLLNDNLRCEINAHLPGCAAIIPSGRENKAEQILCPRIL